MFYFNCVFVVMCLSCGPLIGHFYEVNELREKIIYSNITICKLK